MRQDRQSKLLTDEIEAILSSSIDEDGLYYLIKESLTQTKRGLATKTKAIHYRPWPLLALIVCESISGQYERALPAAAALQLYMAAGDVFDDIEDADSIDSIPARHGVAVATNIATTILTLANKAITRLVRRGVTDHLIVRVIDIVNSLSSTACAGQHLDLSLSPNMAMSEDIYFKITGMKSASQIECACHVGALLATEDQELINIFTKFGHNLGVASQIANDIQGITCGRDLLKRKMTLPVIYALSQSDEEVRHKLEITFSKQSEAASDSKQIEDLLFRTGAIHYATIKMELYKQQALDCLCKAEEKGSNVERLKLFLE